MGNVVLSAHAALSIALARERREISTFTDSHFLLTTVTIAELFRIK